jgi:phosphatidylglycerophosphatase A
MRPLLRFLGSTAFTGYFPFAPATVSSFLVVIILWLWAPSFTGLLIAFIVSLLLSVPIAYYMEKEHGKDPGACTIDEVVGLLLPLVFIGVPLNVPGTWKLLLAAFFLFRFFDIAKIWPANKLESLPGGWGIVTDDLMAGVYTFVALKLMVIWFPWI